MSMAEFVELAAYFRIEPWGSRIDDYRAAKLGSVVAEFSTIDWSKNKFPEQGYFMPDYVETDAPGPSIKQQTVDEAIAKMKVLTNGNG
jgi:hypothetical protein